MTRATFEAAERYAARGAPRRARRRAGLSLIEMVTVISLTGLISVGLAGMLQTPLNGYVAVSRRAELVDLAHLALGRLTRDLRRALPNSVRVAGGGTVLELMHTVGGGRYRAQPGVNDPGGPGQVDHTAPSDWLSFGGDTRFNLIGRFQSLSFSYGTALPGGTRLAIYPTGSALWSDAASGANPGVITPASSTVSVLDDTDEDQLVLDTSHRFALSSPSARVFVVDTPVTYLCDAGTQTLWRVDGYPITSGQPTSLGSAPLSAGAARRAADRIESCGFDYQPGTPSRAGLVTVEIVLAYGEERVRLLQQVQVQNAP